MKSTSERLFQIRTLIALQSKLMCAFQESFPNVKDWAYLLDCPKAGEVIVDGQIWNFRVHGGGIGFTSPDGVVIDMHQALTKPALVDAWRVLQYVESIDTNVGDQLTESSIEAELRAFVISGHLLEVKEYGGYRLSSQS